MFQDYRRLRQGQDVGRGGRAGQADGQEELPRCPGQLAYSSQRPKRAVGARGA